MSLELPARKTEVSACLTRLGRHRAAGLALVAIVASSAGLVASVARGTRAAPVAAGEANAAGLASRAGDGAVRPSSGAVAGTAARHGDAARTGDEPGTRTPAVAGLPPESGPGQASADASRKPRRTRAQRLVSAQLDAMVARARQQVPDAASEDAASEAPPDATTDEVRLQSAHRVLAGMLEGFAGEPSRAQGSPDAATDRP
jgi:hypothetical protein